MEDRLVYKKLNNLLEEGKNFNYSNFAKMSPSGYPKSYESDYISWKTRTQVLLEGYFGYTSPVFKNFREGAEVPVLGNTSSSFDRAHSYFLAAIKSA